MAKTDTAETLLQPRDRVTLTRDIRGVREGASGRVRVANGLTWARYWVEFDNGMWIGSVSATDLVREGGYEAFKVRRAEEALRPKEQAQPTEAAAAPAAGGAAGGAAGRVPAHLLERSQKARARKAAAGAE